MRIKKNKKKNGHKIDLCSTYSTLLKLKVIMLLFSKIYKMMKTLRHIYCSRLFLFTIGMDNSLNISTTFNVTIKKDKTFNNNIWHLSKRKRTWPNNSKHQHCN